MGVQTSERLLENSEKIMCAWEKRAKSEIRAAINQDSLILRDELSHHLQHIANALSTTIDRTDVRVRWDINEGTRLGKLHGVNRARQALYTIDQLILEFHILRQVICEVMEKEIPLSNIEREIITCTIEQAVNDAATEFSTTIMNIQRELIHTLAHDLRSPITAAKIIAQHLQRNEPCRVMAERIAKNMDRLDLMIQGLLDTGRLNSGEQMPLEFKECDLDSIIKNTVEELNFIYNNRFKYISSGECMGLWSEKGLQRLIENLATNAIKYGLPNTEIIVTLDNSGEEILFSVHNEGPAISPKDQEFLFEKYHRNYSSEEKTGWGLGLTVVQAMAYAHKGKVAVESSEGKGTTFIVTFPKK